MRQFASKTGSLIIKHPFWIFVIGSLGIHAAFAVTAPSPLKKAETPREVIVSTLPVIKLPPKSLSTNSKSNKSLFENLFVTPSTNKLSTFPANTFPTNTFPNILSLRALDLNSLERLESLPPVTNNFEEASPLNSNDIDTPQFVKPQTRVPVAQVTPPPRFNNSGQIDNTSPAKTANNSSNVKPEFQNSIKTDASTPPVNSAKDTFKLARSFPSSASSSNTPNIGGDEKEIGNISLPYTNDKQIIDLVSKNLIKATQVAPEEALVSNPDLNREKGVAWIPPKRVNIAGKSGSVTFMWLVAPDGKIQAKFLKLSGDKELDDIVRETVKDYKFKPIDDPQSGKYRLVTAKYNFPYK